MGTLIDTSIFIALERGSIDRSVLSERVGDSAVCLSAITASELLVGVHRADTQQRRARRSAFVEQILDRFDVIPVDLEVSRVHARLWADLQARGELIGAHDSWIAATALAYDHHLATRNRREFERIDDLVVESW